jgi:LmeA-like phospholipid-binding
MRKFLIALVILVVVLVVIDRAAVLIAEREIGTRVQSAYGLPGRPGVSVHGFPFLTQIASGQYQEIDVSIKTANTDGVQLRDIQARFTGVHAPVSLLFGQGSGSVTATHATGTALLPYAQVQRRLPKGITLAAHGSSLRVSGKTPLGSVHTTVGVGVTRTGISVSADVLGSRLSYVIPVGQLPLHLSVTGVRVTGGGLVIAASAHNVAFAKA